MRMSTCAWAQAQEVAKSIPMMEKAAAKSEEGELYVRLGNVYLDGDQFSKSADSIIKGLNKGGVKRPDQARLALGMAYFNLGDYDEARKAFRAACKDGARRKEWQRSHEMAQQRECGGARGVGPGWKTAPAGPRAPRTQGGAPGRRPRTR